MGCRGYATVSPSADKLSLFLQDLETGDSRLLMERQHSAVPYSVHEETFESANSRLCSIMEGLVVIDECGRLELEGRGFAPALEHIRSTKPLSAVLAVRDSFLQEYLDYFAPEEVEVLRP